MHNTNNYCLPTVTPTKSLLGSTGLYDHCLVACAFFVISRLLLKINLVSPKQEKICISFKTMKLIKKFIIINYCLF